MTSPVSYVTETYEANRLDQYTSVSSQAYQYALNGNLTFDGQRTFTYSSENQLLSVTGAALEVQSPALGLIHEADHAASDIKDPVQHRIDRTTPSYNEEFVNVSERNAIVNTETPAAEAWGEHTREAYTGDEVRVACPLCTEEIGNE